MVIMKEKGFTILFAVIVSILVLAAGISIANISLRQLSISGVARESQKAFYAANTGTECAEYWDTQGFPVEKIIGETDGQTIEATITTPTFHTPPRNDTSGGTGEDPRNLYNRDILEGPICSGQDISEGFGLLEGALDLPGLQSINDGFVSGTIYKTSFEFDVTDENGEPQFCSQVDVYKFRSTRETDNEKVITVIESQGLNIPCDDLTSAARPVQRGIRTIKGL